MGVSSIHHMFDVAAFDAAQLAALKAQVAEKRRFTKARTTLPLADGTGPAFEQVRKLAADVRARVLETLPELSSSPDDDELLYTQAGAKAETTHIDQRMTPESAAAFRAGVTTRGVTVVLSIENNTVLDVWLQSHNMSTFLLQKTRASPRYPPVYRDVNVRPGFALAYYHFTVHSEPAFDKDDLKLCLNFEHADQPRPKGATQATSTMAKWAGVYPWDGQFRRISHGDFVIE